MDAHGDLNTPDTSPSGFFDGMAISVAMGTAWPTLTAKLPGFHPLDPRNVVHVGARDFDPPELEVIERTSRSSARHVFGASWPVGKPGRRRS